MATATKKCPLWSDNKVLHDTELARAAKEAREKLKKANVKLDIDPLKDIPDAPVQESVEDTRTALFLRWTALLQVLGHTRGFILPRNVVVIVVVYKKLFCTFIVIP